MDVSSYECALLITELCGIQFIDMTVGHASLRTSLRASIHLSTFDDRARFLVNIYYGSHRLSLRDKNCLIHDYFGCIPTELNACLLWFRVHGNKSNKFMQRYECHVAMSDYVNCRIVAKEI